MTEAERARQLADEIDDELNELRGRFANRENDHFSFGLKFSSWDTIARALRLLAETRAPAGDLREVVTQAIRATRGCAPYCGPEATGSEFGCACQNDADAALSAIATAGYVILPREPIHKFSIGDRVTKTKGSSWTGRVVGFYSTYLTPIGYAVESETETGSVQIYPESALTTKEPTP